MAVVKQKGPLSFEYRLFVKVALLTLFHSMQQFHHNRGNGNRGQSKVIFDMFHQEILNPWRPYIRSYIQNGDL